MSGTIKRTPKSSPTGEGCHLPHRVSLFLIPGVRRDWGRNFSSRCKSAAGRVKKRNPTQKRERKFHSILGGLIQKNLEEGSAEGGTEKRLINRLKWEGWTRDTGEGKVKEET